MIDFSQYIEVREPLPYGAESEARREILSFVDALCCAVFTIRDLWEEPLDMRGVVITPRECQAALAPPCASQALTYAAGSQEDRNSIGHDLREILEYLQARGESSLRAGVPLRIWSLCRTFSLKSWELLLLFLATALEWNRKYERLYGYIQDNVAARQPTLGLGLSLCELVFQKEWEEPSSGSPLFSCLLKAEGGSEKESRLSAPLVLCDTVLNYLREGEWLRGPWSVIASRDTRTGEMLTVSLSNWNQYRKETNRSVRSLAGELTASALGMGLKSVLLNYRRTDDSQEESEQEKTYLSSLLRERGLSAEWRAVEGERESGAFCVSVKNSYTWEDLILEPESKQLLRQICNQIKYRDVVREQWGFGKRDPYGNGIAALFFGPPGTGKTMAAQVIAGELGKKLYKVDLSGLVSKYIGETEKHVSSLFEIGRKSGAILFFDEADGLFAKRSEVGSSNDRYANTETGFLLQKLEEYEGISILATNYLNNIDDAFKRRIRFLVRFPFPSPDMRILLWRCMFPDPAPVEEDLRLEIPARRFELSGSAIREVAIQAAYLAAAAGRGLRKRDIGGALKLHFVKYGKTVAKEELEW